jgi:hypothetical protein
MGERICNCKIPKNMSLEDTQKNIEDYIATLDEAECVSDRIYEQRLELCSNCDGLYDGISCKYCGCFVLVRAKRKNKLCPYPYHSKWGIVK